jgi:hypothetical protein
MSGKPKYILEALNIVSSAAEVKFSMSVFLVITYTASTTKFMMKTTGNARSDFWKGKFFNAFSVAK